MSWKDLLQTEPKFLVYPWTHGREVRTGDRLFKIDGKLPEEPGWYKFQLHGASGLRLIEKSDPEELNFKQDGYLVGDRFIPDSARVESDWSKIIYNTQKVWLVEDGLERFARIQVGRAYENGPLIFICSAFPREADDSVRLAFQDKAESVTGIPHVTPALDAAFRFESWRRIEIQRLRDEAEKKRIEEEKKLAEEERIRKIRETFDKSIGSSASRRELAAIDFDVAAAAALTVGGAVFVDSRKAYGRNEMVVTFKIRNRNFECVCDKKTLQIIDAGICLTDHDTGVRGDTRFTLESLPGVIRQAEREGKLVVFRHADGGNDEEENDW